MTPKGRRPETDGVSALLERTFCDDGNVTYTVLIQWLLATRGNWAPEMWFWGMRHRRLHLI